MSDASTPSSEEPAPAQRCPQCGSTLSTGTPVGMCPKCLLLGVPDAELDWSHDPEQTIPTPGPRQAAGTSPRSPPWQPPAAEELAEMLPQYEVRKLLGRGGMGAVYKGRQVELDRLVAIKILPPDLGDEHDFAGRFKLEARAMARLKHPSIVTVFDFGQTAEGLLYFVMEFVEGMDVQQMIAQEKRLRSADAIAVAAHVCEALHYAHSHGIIHRDIKPANVIVGHDGHVRVADFGLVKVMNAAQTSHLTLGGNVMGTPNYLAPEALTVGMSVDHRVDIYAVGVMLYHMLTGRVPHGAFAPASLKVPGLDPRLDGIIAHAMREDRDQRYQSAEELRSDLVSILTQPVPQTVPVAARMGSPPAAAASAQTSPQRRVIAARPVIEEEEYDDEPEFDPSLHAILRTTNSMNTTMLVLGGTALLVMGALAFFLANRKTGDVINTRQTITNSSVTNSYFTQIIATGATTAEELQAIAEIRPFGDRFIGVTREALSWSQVSEVARRTGAQIMTVEDGDERKKLMAWLDESYSSHLSSSAAWVQEHGEARLIQSKEIVATPDLAARKKALLEWRVPQISGGSTITTNVIEQNPPQPKAPEPMPVAPAPMPAPAVKTPTPASPPDTAAMLLWTDKDGRVIQARFVKLDGDSVVIEKDGKQFAVPFTNLSPASIEQARKLGARPQ